MFSGISGFGDWNEVIAGMPHHAALRLAMTLGGTVLYLAFIRWLAVTVKPFVPERWMYNLVERTAVRGRRVVQLRSRRVRSPWRAVAPGLHYSGRVRRIFRSVVGR